jgi:hypothetical protein
MHLPDRRAACALRPVGEPTPVRRPCGPAFGGTAARQLPRV